MRSDIIRFPGASFGEFRSYRFTLTIDCVHFIGLEFVSRPLKGASQNLVVNVREPLVSESPDFRHGMGPP
jgi:hypothetical protein